MIRFLKLDNQICDNTKNFAFYDTVSDYIISFGAEGRNVFSSKEDFIYEYKTEINTRPLERFIGLIPEEY